MAIVLYSARNPIPNSTRNHMASEKFKMITARDATLIGLAARFGKRTASWLEKIQIEDRDVREVVLTLANETAPAPEYEGIVRGIRDHTAARER